MFILDTNILIYYFKGMGRVAEHFLTVDPSEIAVPVIVVYEIEAGLARLDQVSKRRKQFDALIESVQVLDFNSACARASAQIRAQLESKGALIGPLDLLLAGTALAYAGVFVTHNSKEFSRVKGLKLVDWYS